MGSKLDDSVRYLLIGVLFLLVLLYGSSFEVPYSKNLVDLHAIPLWRFALVLMVLFAAFWSPRVGILAALVVFCYLSDLEKLTTPFVNM